MSSPSTPLSSARKDSAVFACGPGLEPETLYLLRETLPLLAEQGVRYSVIGDGSAECSYDALEDGFRKHFSECSGEDVTVVVLCHGGLDASGSHVLALRNKGGRDGRTLTSRFVETVGAAWEESLNEIHKGAKTDVPGSSEDRIPRLSIFLATCRGNNALPAVKSLPADSMMVTLSSDGVYTSCVDDFLHSITTRSAAIGFSPESLLKEYLSVGDGETWRPKVSVSCRGQTATGYNVLTLCDEPIPDGSRGTDPAPTPGETYQIGRDMDEDLVTAPWGTRMSRAQLAEYMQESDDDWSE